MATSVPGPKIIALLALLVLGASLGLWLWARATPIPVDLDGRQPGQPLPGVLN